MLAGKLSVGGLLQRLLLNLETVARGEHASMFGPERPFREDEKARLRETIERSYQLFLERVAASRSRTPEEIDRIAGGRVWTGRQALENGLVDELGGFEKALAAARRLGGLAEDSALREARGDRDTAPTLSLAAAVVDHALTAVSSLNRAGTWYLCPWV